MRNVEGTHGPVTAGGHRAAAGKLRREPAGSTAPPGRVDELARAVQAVLRKQFSAIRSAQDRFTRQEDPEAVHDMRVAVRRSRAVLRLFDGDLESDGAQRAAQGLRQFGRRLGTLRDLEVLGGSFERALSVMGRREREALRPVARALQRETRGARSKLERYLAGPTHARFLARYPSLVEGLRAVQGPRAAGFRQAARNRLTQRVQAARSAAKAVDPSRPRAKDLHNLRIRLKELRYAIEFLAPLFGRGSSPVLARLRRAQDNLGAIQDLEVEAASLRNLASRHELSPPAHAALNSVLRARREELKGRVARAARTVRTGEDKLLAGEAAILFSLLGP